MSLRHRLFAYLLVWRPPLESELGDIDAALRQLVTKQHLLAILMVYAAVLYFAVWPAFSQPHDLLYRVVAVVITHLLLWFIAWVTATCSVGFRSWQNESSIAPQVVGGLLIAAALGKAGATRLRWIQASLGSQIRLIPVEDVLFFQSDLKYTRVVTRDGESLIRKPLRELLDELDPQQFWQVHRSTIVNSAAIAHVVRENDRLSIALKHGTEQLEVSRSFTHLFKSM